MQTKKIETMNIEEISTIGLSSIGSVANAVAFNPVSTTLLLLYQLPFPPMQDKHTCVGQAVHTLIPSIFLYILYTVEMGTR